MTYNTSILKKGINAAFDKQYMAMQERPYLKAIESIFMRSGSTSESETYAWLGDVPGVTEWIGSKNLKGLNDYEYSIKNKNWYSGFSIDENEIEDEKISAIMPRVGMLAQGLSKFPAELIIDLITAGTTGLAYDGAAFFSNRTAPNDNLLAGTGVTSALLKTDITAARTAMMKFTSDQGKVMGLMMDTILCPPELEALFLELTTSVSGESTVRPEASWIKNVIVCPELSDTNDWYGLASDAPLKPFIYQTRKGIKQVLDDTQRDDTRKLKYSAEARSNAGYGFFQMAVKTVNA